VNTPAFSVIIPAYNAAATLSRAIESVLAQRYAAHEIIVVDDGSTDETATTVASYGGRLRYVFQSNSGVSAARNAGAYAATGDWLAFLDADDWYYPERLNWHADWIRRDPGLDFLTGDYEYRRPDGTLISRSMEITAAGSALLRKAMGKREVVMEASEMAGFIENHFGDTHTLSVPRDTFLELGGYPLGREVCEDVNFLIRLCARGERVGVICEPMAVYLIHSQSATRRDPLRSQQLTVEALLPLKRELASASSTIRRGYRGRLRRARLNLSYALLRQGKGMRALSPVLATLLETPSLASLRDFGSIALGAMQSTARPSSTLFQSRD
jgi:hypothetical protein